MERRRGPLPRCDPVLQEDSSLSPLPCPYLGPLEPGQVRKCGETGLVERASILVGAKAGGGGSEGFPAPRRSPARCPPAAAAQSPPTLRPPLVPNYAMVFFYAISKLVVGKVRALFTGVFPEGENRGRRARAGADYWGKARSPGWNAS